ncbi:hypothetical protein SteCoe_29196 [Stentor coeruleus]|uniref:Uncharacterized protein n=1 Tax=Stentor coeruleus TaxID=5963 RepID=A0A1R2B6I5_9CILI|nr:hypothetical protein SteCoe_29196 [Stentor coeruleus]
MDLKHDISFQRAYNFKKHQKKLEEIKKSPTKRLDNHLPPIFINKRRSPGYKGLWWNYKVNKENMMLLDKLIKIKEKKRHHINYDRGHSVEPTIHERVKKLDNETSFNQLNNASTVSYRQLDKVKKRQRVKL